VGEVKEDFAFLGQLPDRLCAAVVEVQISSVGCASHFAPEGIALGV